MTREKNCCGKSGDDEASKVQHKRKKANDVYKKGRIKKRKLLMKMLRTCQIVKKEI
jgi:hypothetical protein